MENNRGPPPLYIYAIGSCLGFFSFYFAAGLFFCVCWSFFLAIDKTSTCAIYISRCVCWPTGTQEPARPLQHVNALHTRIAALRPSRILFLLLLLLCREFPMNCCCWACAFSYTLHNFCVYFFFVSRGLSADKTWPFQSAPRLFLRVSIEISIGEAAISTSPSLHILVN